MEKRRGFQNKGGGFGLRARVGKSMKKRGGGFSGRELKMCTRSNVNLSLLICKKIKDLGGGGEVERREYH